MAPNLQARTVIAHDSIQRSPTIIAEHANDGATADSSFISDQLPALDPAARPYPESIPTAVEVVNSDSFAAARNVIANDAGAKVSVLNLASDILPAGPWLEVMTTTQEEALCYSSTLYVTLKESYYPWPNVGAGSIAGIYSPGVVIFRDDLDHDCAELPKADRRVVSVITVAAPRHPVLTPDGQSFKFPNTLGYLQEKIRLVYRMAAHNKQEYLILGAMGCGAYGCPAQLVAVQMRDILLEPEFKGWFKQVFFAIYSSPSNGPGNFDIFQKAFEGVKI